MLAPSFFAEMHHSCQDAFADHDDQQTGLGHDTSGVEKATKLAVVEAGKLLFVGGAGVTATYYGR